jgi:DsbE subfamily thiol:disulfide oxidoreductase
MKSLKFVGIGVFAVLAVSTVVMLFGQNKSEEAATGLSGTIAPAPSWELQDANGKTIHSSDFKGKVVILDFWATWCPPCKAEIPGFIALQNEYGKKGLAVVGISVDEGGAAVVKQFAQQSGMNYPVVLADEKTPRAFGGIEAIPTTFIIDREGRIVTKHLGFTEKEEFEKELKPLLNP